MQKVKVFFIRFLVVLLAFQGTVAAQLININSARASGIPPVVINELMWMGTKASLADEWIELRNTTNAAIDLSGWQLTNSAPSNGTLTIPTGKSIEANGYFLISNYDQANASSILNVASDWVTTSLSLGNTCESGMSVYIQLLGLSDTDPPTITDQAGCSNSGGSPLKGVNSPGAKKAMERNIVIADGLLGDSWHDSTLQVNLDLGAIDYASPRAINEGDSTPPLNGIVNDGVETDIDWSANSLGVTANWSGFTDPESGVTNYSVGLGTTPLAADFMPFVSVGLVETYNFVFPVPTTSGTFYVLVKAVNGAGIVGEIKASDGFTIDLADPAVPTGLTITDTPLDNGGSLKATWTASTSLDEITYQLNYRKVGDIVWTSVVAGNLLEKVVTGLQNAPVNYEFTVEAIDFNAQHSAVSTIVIGQALDNLVPIIDINKIVVGQNKPGSDDTVSGQTGASNEGPVTVTLLSATPGDPTAVVIGSVISNADGSFAAIGIGDNKYDQVWLQLTDSSSNLSLPLKLSNDIVGPTAPVLNKVVAKCESETCRVTLDWQSGSSDTASYKVVYTVDGVDHQTFEVTATALALDLPSGKTYLFKVVGYDQFGNPSSPSNIFSVTLTKGVKTIVTGSGTTTEGISGSTRVSTATVPKTAAPVEFVPKAKAAEPVVETPIEPEKPLVQGSNSQGDWVRILVVVVLLLIIAGSFYALSRSVKETPEEEFDRNKADSKDDAVAGTTKRRGRRRHRR